MEELTREKDKIINNLQQQIEKLTDERQSSKSDLISTMQLVHQAKRAKEDSK